MTPHIAPAAVLLLTTLAVASCDPGTEPETSDSRPAITPAVAAAANSWTTRRDLPSTERRSLATATVTNAAGESIVYAIGGQATANGGSLSKVQAYNATTNTWTHKAPLPMPLYWTNGAGVINGKIYISGGVSSYKNYRSELFMYDPATNRWTQKRDMPNSGFRGITGVFNNQLYVLTNCDQEDCWEYQSVAFYRYDPVTDLWATLPDPAQQSFAWGVGGFIGGKFYAMGFGNLEAYDPATGQWTTRASMGSSRWLAAGGPLAGKLYVIGGYRRTSDGTLTSGVRTTSVYDPGTNTWTNKAPLPSGRSHNSASRVEVNGQARFEVIGGSPPGNNLQYTP